MNYDFTTLDPTDFEALTSDLFSRMWGSQLESFKPGKDGGIDLRHSRTPAGEPNTIIQCKRYAPHKFNELIRSLKKECKKLESLQPERYLVVTSVNLSAANKDKILSELTPWCKSTGDIYGAHEVNALLRNYPDVVKAHFKLWISSTAVLESVLHSKIFAITDATVESTKYELSKLVVHEGLRKALELLGERHHALIVGNPGIGKTTLARMLMCHYLQEGFEPIWIVSNISDAWAIINQAQNSKRKLVIVYDDFLGRLKFDSQRFDKNEDHSLMQLLDKVARSPNLRFILTTREYILSDAKRVHGAFDMRAGELISYTLSLEEYTRQHRAKILFNHLYFSNLPDSRLKNLLEKRTYQKIIAHKHYNPRIVETISNYANSQSMTDDEYIYYIEQEFDNPSQLWEHPFRRDISHTARLLLVILWSCRGSEKLETIKTAVAQLNKRLHPEEFSLEFDDALRQLDGNFIQSGKYHDKGYGNEAIFIKFQNPSVEEYIRNVVQAETAWLNRALSVANTLTQVTVIADAARQVSKNEKELRSSGFWMKLRTSADKHQSKHSGQLTNLFVAGHAESISSWSINPKSKSEIAHDLLKIENDVRENDAYSESVRANVLSIDGWAQLLADLPSYSSIAYDVHLLQIWVMNDSGWSDSDKQLSDQCFQDSLLELLEKECFDWIEFNELSTLVEACMQLNSNLSDHIKDAFVSVARTITNNIILNEEEDDAYIINYEADNLKAIAILLNTDMDSCIAELHIRSEELEEKNEEDEPSNPDKSNHSVQNEAFDVESLFSGLLDR